MASDTATPEQIYAYKNKVYEAYKNNNLQSLVPKNSLLKIGFSRRIKNIFMDTARSEYVKNAQGLSGNELWNYASNMESVLKSAGDNFENLYDDAINKKIRRNVFNKLGGEDSKLGD